MNIIVVDDHALNRKLLRALLEAEDHNIVEAADGQEALAVLERQELDAIISDVLMPNMDGFRLCLEVRKHARLRRMAFVIYTSTYSSAGDRELALQVGADAYIVKPAPADMLFKTLAEAREKAASRSDDSAVTPDEIGVIKQYNAALVSKLEKKNEDLEAAIAQLRESETRFRQVVENIHEVFWMTDVEKHSILYVSPRYETIWGRTCASLCAEPGTWLEAIHSNDRERVRLAAFTKQASGEYCETFRVVRPDGSTRWICDRAYPIHDANGKVSRVVGVAEDVTERKKLEEQFLRAQRLEAVGTLAGGVAHDLNNILAPMMMVASLLKEQLRDPRDRELLTIVEQSAQRGANVVRQLLTFSRGLGGERGPVQLRHLLDETATIMQETFPREIVIRKDVRRDLQPVFGDATQLHQVLMNLCVNARDAMPRGGELKLACENVTLVAAQIPLDAKSEPGAFVALRVSDTGEGIAPENLQRVFEPFFTTKAVGVGTGLGLSTVVGLVKGHGGFVTVTSELGRGSTFTVHLPAIVENLMPRTVVARAPMVRGNGQLILIADDEAAIRLALSQMLQARGYRVLAAADGREALTLFLEHRDEVRLLFTDVMMPAMGGVALIRALRPLAPNLKIVVTSGLDDRAREEDIRELEIAEFLGKPCRAEDILDALLRHLPGEGEVAKREVL